MPAESIQKDSDTPAEPGSKVVAHYKLRLEDGSVIDQTQPDSPLSFTIGDGTFPSGVEPIFYGLKSGDKDRRTVSPEQGWGYPDPGNIQYLLRSDFPDNEMLAPGNVIEFRLPNDESLPGTVLDIEDERIKVDFNPPLAGHKVTIEIDILAVNKA